MSDPLAFVDWTGKPLELPAKPAAPRVLTIEDVQRAVAEHFRCTVVALTGRSRLGTISRARHVAMFLIRQHVELASWPIIGRAFGGRDHTTAMAGANKIASRILFDTALAAHVRALEKALGLKD